MLNSTQLSEADIAKYRLLMGNVANSAQRQWTAIGKGPFLVGRRWNFSTICIPGIGQFGLNKAARSEIRSINGDRKDQLSAEESVNFRRKNCLSLRPRWRTFFSLSVKVAADNQGGYHAINGRRQTTGDHRWFGMSPFISADPSFFDPGRNHFGYPCSIVFLGKKMGQQTQPFQLETAYEAGNGTRENNGLLDMGWTRVGGSRGAGFRSKTGGMLAVAVARAVYHRPGDWKEQPNFFNPLWNARLAPVVTHWESTMIEGIIPDWATSRIGNRMGPHAFTF